MGEARSQEPRFSGISLSPTCPADATWASCDDKAFWRAVIVFFIDCLYPCAFFILPVAFLQKIELFDNRRARLDDLAFWMPGIP